jgi:hypothetical protein
VFLTNRHAGTMNWTEDSVSAVIELTSRGAYGERICRAPTNTF